MSNLYSNSQNFSQPPPPPNVPQQQISLTYKNHNGNSSSNSQWVIARQFANQSSQPRQLDTPLMKQLTQLIQQVHQNSPLITEAHKRKAANRLRDILFSTILSNSLRLKTDNIRLDRESIQPYVVTSANANEDPTKSLHRKITSITFEMRSNNEYTKALSLEVLISHVIAKPKTEWKCYSDFNAQTLKQTDKASILKLISVLADAAALLPSQTTPKSTSTMDSSVILSTAPPPPYQPSPMSITSILLNSLLTERNLMPDNQQTKEVQKKSLNLFRFGTSSNYSNGTRQLASANSGQFDSANQSSSASSFTYQATTPHLLTYKPLGRKNKLQEEISEGCSSRDEVQSEKSSSIPADIQDEIMMMKPQQQQQQQPSMIKSISSSSSLSQSSIDQMNNSLLSIESDIFNLRKGPILPSLTDYAMQTQLGYTTQTKEFTDYSRLQMGDSLMSSKVANVLNSSSLDFSKTNKKDGISFPMNVFELNKNSNDSMQSLMGAFQRKQEEKTSMPFSISLSIPAIGQQSSEQREYNPMSSFAQLNSKREAQPSSQSLSAFGISSGLSMNSAIGSKPIAFGISSQQQQQQQQLPFGSTSMGASNLWKNDQTVYSEQMPSFVIGTNRENPMSISQLDHNNNNNAPQMNNSKISSMSQSQLKTSNISMNNWNNQKDTSSSIHENQFVLNPTQIHHIAVNQSILEQNISNQLKANSSEVFNRSALASILRDEQQKGEQRRFGFQKGLEHCNNDINRILSHKSEIISSSLWEDYDIRKSKIQNKNLAIASSSAIFTQEKCAALITQSNKHFSNLLQPEPLQVEEQYVLNRLILMLQGIESELFILHPATSEFTLNQLSITLTTITHETLNMYLNRFIEPGTKILRLYEILKLYRPNKFQANELQEVITLVEVCMECWESQVLALGKNESASSPCTLMELGLELRESLREIELIYELLFSRYLTETQFAFDVNLAYASLPSSTELLNVLFVKLSTDSICSLDQAILFTFFQRILSPLSRNLTSVVLFATHETILYKNLPTFLVAVYPRIEECAMNLALMKVSDLDHFHACSKLMPIAMKQEQFVIEISLDIHAIRSFEEKYKTLFQTRMSAINELLQAIKYAKELKNAEEIKQKLQYITQMKENYHQRMQEIQEKKQKEHAAKLRKAKEESDEIELRRVQKKYERLLKQEQDKAIILDNQLKEKVRIEQQKLDLLQLKLREAKQTGQAATTSSDELDKTSSELKRLYEKALQNLPYTSTDVATVVSEDVNLKDIYDEARNKMEVEETKQQQAESAEQSAYLNSLYSEKQQMQIESNINEATGTSEIPLSIDTIKNKNTIPSLLQSPNGSKMDAFETPTRLNNQMDVESEGAAAADTVIVKGNNNKGTVQNNFEQSKQQLIEEEEEEEELEAKKVTSRHNIPISVIVQACLSNVIQQQAALTNKAVLNLVFEKYSMQVILEFLKKYMFCERGDKIDYFLDVIIKENGRIEILSLYEASTFLFDEEDFIRPLNEFQPYLEFQKDDAPFQAYNIFSTDLSSLLKLRIRNLPKIMEVLFNEESLSNYLRVFAHFIRFRYASKLLQQKWKQINKFISTQHKTRGIYDEYNETFKQKNRLGRLAQSLRHKIQHFMTSFQAYAYYDIVENAWNMLNRSLGKCQTLQDLLIIHSNYMKYIQMKTFMRTTNQKIEQYLAEILSILVQFVNILERVISIEQTSYRSKLFAHNSDQDDDDEDRSNEETVDFVGTIAKLSALDEKFGQQTQQTKEFLSQLIEKIKENENMQSEIASHISATAKQSTTTTTTTKTF